MLSLGTAYAQEAHSRHFLFLGDLNSRYNREIWYMGIPAIIFSILIFLGVSIALFYSVAKFRERKTDTREAAQFHGNNALEIVLIIIPLIIVTVLTVLTARTMVRTTTASAQQPGPTQTGKAEHIQISGAQFWWNFQYPKHGDFRNSNEMVVPAARPLNLEITAADVMHAWWAPNLGGQRDAIPGVRKFWTVDTDQPGIYQGNCSLLCGASHANMRFKVVVLPQNDYDTFVNAAKAYRAPEPVSESEQHGYQLFAEGKAGAPACQSCHRVQGTPFKGAAGPDLSFFGSRFTLGAGMWEGSKARTMLPEWIKHSKGVKPGSLMPSYPQLNDQDVTDLIAYLDTLKLPDEAAYWRWDTGQFKVPVR